MGNVKQAKRAKEAKQPKPAFKDKDKKSKKQLEKEQRLLDKKLERRLGFVAIFLCLISSVLDMLLRNKSRQEDKINR